ncbi:MAG: bifunctional ornithine acetyltransferase/N-acetylglutamate synthase [Clostridia bacterium]|jgi:glutamate N-acetyltransferase/amino-acid N-acetyltransferase|nr:bifunctional ornithine acetyltransferase/N-acetylglutamate synthase [Clostridia bacterium]MCI1999802.1 bifunctional ornithine acetyltransferase/N-acetylglutamate synthase [Clostridia bacterium]MCI2014282.1 bifunctional ornithine acetyltransferase/N-acetylglutamate synthase [Clostridia bacterium]
MKSIEGSVTAAKGFKATGFAAGIKKDKKDLALIASDVPATAAGAFTTNVVKATSVMRNMQILEKGIKISGIVANSGNANACTGSLGVKSNKEMAECYAKCLGVESNAVLTASTGVIGATFPIEKITDGIKGAFHNLGYKRDDALLAAEAIMTTDTYSKEVAVEFELGGKTVHMGGMAKGSGMICPNMATMLSFITTDANISWALLNSALKEDIKSTYNMVSVDGDTSTNDTVIVLANGMAENECVETEGEDYNTFKEALHYINERLAKNLVRDGEGATKFIEVNVNGAKTKDDAKTIAKSVVKSSLFKAAIFGEDANWGRALCAMGYSGVKFDPEKVDIIFASDAGEILLMYNGTPIVFDEDKAKKILSEKEIKVNIVIREGDKSATAWGCDLSYEYVKINGDYRS